MKTTTDSTLDRFRTLEEKISGALDTLRRTRQEKEAAEARLFEARGRITALEQEIEELREERGAIRDRVEGLIADISELGWTKEESGVKEGSRRHYPD